jgi:hypothetical protein
MRTRPFFASRSRSSQRELQGQGLLGDLTRYRNRARVVAAMPRIDKDEGPARRIRFDDPNVFNGRGKGNGDGGARRRRSDGRADTRKGGPAKGEEHRCPGANGTGSGSNPPDRPTPCHLASAAADTGHLYHVFMVNSYLAAKNSEESNFVADACARC